MTHNLKPYSTYKPSGVAWLGEIPEHWELRKLKFIAAQVSEKVEIRSDNINYIGLENIESWTGKLVESELVTEGTASRFRKNDVLFGKLRPYLAKVYLAEEEGCCSTEALVLRTSSQNSRFLFYFLLSRRFIDLVNSSVYGAKMPRASWDFIGSQLLPFPPPDKQRTLAAFLDRETSRIDALIEKKQKQIELLQEKRTALVSRAVTKGLDPNAKMKDSGVEWLGKIPVGWEIWKVTHAFGRIGSGTTPKSDNYEYYDGEIPWVTTSELRETGIDDTLNRITEEALRDYPTLRLYPAGTLLFAMYGATVGRLGVLKISATVNQACAAFSEPIKLDPKFTYYWLYMRRPILIAISAGGGQPNLSQDDLKQLRIPAPPLQEQRSIAAFLDRETARIDALIEKVEKSLVLLREYRPSLISAAVTGKIDIRKEAA